MPLGTGQVFAGYTIVSLLGSGGMGEVYLAQHPRLPRRDALKLLPRDWSADAEYRARFNQEADLASTLWHPHIVGVHDRGEEDGQLWISMDFVDGLDAARLLTDRYPDGMPGKDVTRIITAVASALDHAHKQGLLHRDVKPANVMVTHLDDEGDQRILLTDFGIARNVDDISGLTKTNMTVGTVAYCAPEQLLGEDIDGRADQYSLAATAFHLLTGAHLFPHSNPLVVSNRHLNVAPPSLAESRPELAHLDSVLAIGLAKRPEHRFKRCSDFARALSDQMNPAGASTPAAPTTPALLRSAEPAVDAMPPHERKRRTPWAVVAAVVVVPLLIGGLIVAWRPWERQTTSSSTGSPGPLVPAERTVPPIPATTTIQPPPPALFSPKSIDQVLLTADQLTHVLGAKVTSDPAEAKGGLGGLALDSSSYGATDHSDQVTPRSCVGVAFTGEHDVYGGIDSTAIKTQTFSGSNGSSTTAKGPTSLQQTAVVFPSVGQAQSFLSSSQAQWKACTSTTVDVILGFENGRGYVLGDVQHQGDLLTVSMASDGALSGAEGCQQVLGVRENVVVETRSCNEPNASANAGYDVVKQQWTTDPNWAAKYAEHMATAMLDNVSS